MVGNTALTAYTVQQEVHAPDGVYQLHSCEVRTPHCSRGRSGLAAPPKDLAAFIELADPIGHSGRIASQL